MKQKILAVVRLMSTPTDYAPRPLAHVKARCKEYPRNPDIKRFEVPDDKVTWDVAFENYSPVPYTSPSVAAKPPWADPDYSYESYN